MTARLAWEREGRDWPNREASRFVDAGGLSWHVQIMGQGPTMLLLHGAGASTHSWRDLMPALARDFHVIAPDLPGQGFTSPPSGDGYSLHGMARSVAALLSSLHATPQWIVGHSAGCAIAVRMALDGLASPRAIIGVNGALLPFHGVGALFSGLAKLLAINPFFPRLFAHQARSPRVVARLLDDTGSRIDAHGAEIYRRLAQNPGHVAGTLRMMAHWDLDALRRDLPRLRTKLYLLTGMKDGTVDPERAHDVRKLAPQAEIIAFPGLGHLAHEERPDFFAAHIRQIVEQDSMGESHDV